MVSHSLPDLQRMRHNDHMRRTVFFLSPGFLDSVDFKNPSLAALFGGRSFFRGHENYIKSNSLGKKNLRNGNKSPVRRQP